MEKVLITGGAGFVGANFVYKFLEAGYDVNLIEKKGTNFWRIENVRDKIKLYYPDLTKYNKIERFIVKLEPEIILHFAAYGAYQGWQQDIKTTIDVNLLGTINLINACSKTKFKCFINAGSNSEYGVKDKPMKENDLPEANNLYGITKAGGTMYCQYMARKLDLPIVITRPFAVYGYFEEKERLIPTIIKSCLKNSELNLSSPTLVRDFVFIEDIISAYLTIIKNIKKVKGEIFNLATGTQTTIDEAARIVKKITQSPLEPKYDQIKPAQYEPKNWVADISKIKNLLNWQPKYNLREGLEKNIEWFKKNLAFYE